MSAVPPQLQHLALRIGNAAGLAPDDMAGEVTAALRDATAGAGWLPPERRRADHERYARHLLYGDPACYLAARLWNRQRPHLERRQSHICMMRDTWCAILDARCRMSDERRNRLIYFQGHDQ